MEYDQSMTARITVSLPDEQVAFLQQSVQEKQATSVSHMVSIAVRQVMQEDTLEAFVADLIAVHGRPSPEDYAWAKQALDGP